jgi:hypothetical protein
VHGAALGRDEKEAPYFIQPNANAQCQRITLTSSAGRSQQTISLAAVFDEIGAAALAGAASRQQQQDQQR